MTSVPSRVIAWTLPSAKSGWTIIALISCIWVARSSATTLVRAGVVAPSSSIARAMPVDSKVTDGLVITDEPSGMRASIAFARRVEVIDQLDTDSALLERHDGLREHRARRGVSVNRSDA